LQSKTVFADFGYQVAEMFDPPDDRAAEVTTMTTTGVASETEEG
jgi:hypothetical protein